VCENKRECENERVCENESVRCVRTRE
jgi:hypothetical protein